MSTQNQRNKFDRMDSLEMGQSAESRFASLARTRGWAAAEAAMTGERYDYEISRVDRRHRGDVKSKKRISRKVGKVQDDLIWIEFRSVRNTNGWLFGDADLIAFEDHRFFKIVEGKAQVRVINKLVKIHVKVDAPEDALYKVYTRKERLVETTLIKASDLDPIPWEEWDAQ